MLTNYLKIAYRTLLRQKGYAAINVVGLAVGLACFILIGLFVRFELSYDRFHEKADRIYRIAKEDPGTDYLGTNRFAVTPAPLVPALMDAFPEVEHAVQIDPVEVLLGWEGNRFYEEGLYATEHFFDVFSFELLQGDPQTALVEPNAILLTASLARKYFGEADPVGQTLTSVRGSDEGTLTVAGIVADPPPNSHVTFDYLLSMVTSDEYRDLLAAGEWDSSNYRTYVSLRPDYDLAAFEAKLVALARDRLGGLHYYQENPDRISVYFPQALTDIHLRSRLNFELGSGGDVRYVYLFSAIGLLILLIACVNYMNLATARSATRAKEVGVRKVVGAHRAQLAGQFLGEAVILSALALGLAVILADAMLPAFNALTAREMTLGWAEQPGFWFAVVGIGLGVGLLSGSYPAFVLSGFKPAGVMKGVLRRKGRATPRNVLVVVQFAITTALVVGTLAIHQQLRYVQTSDTGMDRDHVVSILVRDRAARAQYDALKQALAQHAGVAGVTASQHSPTQIAGQSGMSAWEGAEEGQRVAVYNAAVQPGFAEVFGIEMVEGRAFSEERASDGGGALINETLARQLGWETSVGKWINIHGWEMPVIGVMGDFNFLSFRQEIAPLALYNDAAWFTRVLVRVRPERTREALTHLEATMAAFSPAYPFEYEFVDDAYDRMYQTEVRLGELFGYFTVLALLVACLGLLGLAAFAAEQRTKEVGVRKVLGASVTSVVALLSKDFLKLVAIAFAIAAPVAYLAMQRWLEGFAYRVELGLGVFLLAGGLALAVALVAVSYHAIKAATADPVKSLRYE